VDLDSYTFDHFVNDFKRSYSSEIEKLHRKALFEQRLEEIKQHNANSSKTWKLGVNQFTDRTEDEFRKMLGVKKGAITKNAAKIKSASQIDYDVRKYEDQNVDWRDKRIVTAVKDQGYCGSCWTFATAETLESYWALAKGQLVDLSEQQILDCTPNPDDCGGTGGCEGGTAELAYARIKELGGLTTEWTYPYVSYTGKDFPCHFNQTNPFATIKDFIKLPENEYEPLLHHIATVGPLAISVDASTWSSYLSGVFDGCNQTNPDIDHAVMLVGYGTDETLGDYWLVRNSWGPAWGEGGYIRLKRSSTPVCGIDNKPSDGDGCNDGPKQVKVCGTCGILYDNCYPVV